MKNTKTSYLLLFLLNSVLFPAISNAQDGALDNSFSGDGKITTSYGTFDDKAEAIAVVEDALNPTNANYRRIIVAGATHNNNDYDIMLVRYDNNGNIDHSFGSHGIVTTDIDNLDNSAKAMAVQKDGKIVIAATVDILGTSGKFAVLRYNANGTLDTSFNGTGKVIIPLGNISAGPTCIAIQNDGKIVVAGHSHDGGKDMDIALVRLTDSGVLDNTFDGDGIVLTTLGQIGTNDYASDIAIQNDGKIVIAATTHQPTNSDFAVLRYTNTGALDNSFSSDGKVITPINGTFNETCTALRIQKDGKILVAGGSNSTFEDFILVRYESNGNYDNAFGANGIVKTDIDFGTSTDEGTPTSLVLQDDNKIVVAGYGANGINNNALDFVVARYESSGVLDNTFDSDGIVVTDFGSSNDNSNAVAIQSDGKILAAGGSHDGTRGRLAVARYNNPSSILTVDDLNYVKEVKISTNPFSSTTTLYTTKTFKDASLFIYDTLGQKVEHIEHISGSSFTINRKHLTSGVYFIQLKQEERTILNSKLVIND